MAKEGKFLVNAWIDKSMYDRMTGSAIKQRMSLSKWLRSAVEMKLQFEAFQRMQRKQQEDNDET